MTFLLPPGIKGLICHCKNEKKSGNRNLRRASENFLPIKTIFERNEPSTSSHTDTQSPDLKMIYRFHLKLFNLKKHPATITLIQLQSNENNCEPV